MAKDLYEVLGVVSTATSNEIRTAYRKLVLKVHPDHSDDPNSPALFMEITQAYEILSDTKRRRDYDEAVRLRSQVRNDIQARKAGMYTQQAESRPKTNLRSSADKQSLLNNEIQRMTVLYTRGQLDQAKGVAEKILAIDAQQHLPYAILGDIAVSRGQIATASKMFAYAAQMDPMNPTYFKRHTEMLELLTKSTDMSGSKQEIDGSGYFLIAVGVLIGPVVLLVVPAGPSMQGLGPLNALNLPIALASILAGLLSGIAWAMSGLINRFSIVNLTVTGKISPGLLCYPFMLFNYWAGVAIYLLQGVVTGSFNKSAARVVIGCSLLTILLSLATFATGKGDGTEVAIWSGVLVYTTSMLGWALAELGR